MSTKIYNGMIANDVSTISDLSLLKDFLKEKINHRNKEIIFDQFNDFFKWYLEQLFIEKGSADIKGLCLFFRLRKEIFSGIDDVFEIKAEREHFESIVERNLSTKSFDRRINGLIKKQSENIWIQFGIDVNNNDYQTNLFIAYLSCFIGFIFVLNSYTTFFSKFMGNDSMFNINGVYLFPLDNNKLLLYTLSDKLYGELIETPQIDDYHYQNQTDQTSNIPREQWDQRCDDWEKAIRQRIDEGIHIQSTGDDLHHLMFFLNGDKMSDKDKEISQRIMNSFDTNIEKMTKISSLLVKEAIFAKDFLNSKSKDYFQKHGAGSVIIDIQDYCDKEVSEKRKEYFINLIEISKFKKKENINE